MDLAALKSLKPSEYQDAADGYRATSEMAGKAGEALDSRISAGIRNQLSGETAKAALRELKELSKDFHYAAAECALAGAALDGFAFDMAAAKRKLEAALEDAAAAGCTVGADGSVSFPAGGKEVDGKVPEGGTVRVSTSPTDPTSAALERQAVHMHPNPNFGKAVGFADRIGDALKEATDADVKWAPKLRALKADDDLVVSDKDWTDVTSDTAGVRDAGKDYFDSLPRPPEHDDPKKNAAWWQGLTDEQRSDYLSAHPDAVGALDGLPATARDQANRTVLDEAHAKARLDYDAWLKKHPEPERYQPYIDPYTGSMPKGLSVESQEWKDWEEARKNARKSLDGMDAIQTRFDATGVNGLPEAYLLGFSTDGDGRAIIANGNPDTADHQAVYVPGTGSELGNIGGGIDRMTKVWHAANDEADGSPSPRSPGSATTRRTASGRTRRSSTTRTTGRRRSTSSWTGSTPPTPGTRIRTVRSSPTRTGRPSSAPRPRRGMSAPMTSSSPAVPGSRCPVPTNWTCPRGMCGTRRPTETWSRTSADGGTAGTVSSSPVIRTSVPTR
ncbi:hypothetical protein HEP81_03260 [Streptomyces griseofuscus]|uniref:Uncharacterized protein n=1 Tax=Streptomyces griseofuscus TaxID=146922 RepID=A0A7H1PZU0_9ACTN|nr:hypothetical protein HEP81_03260 [Streptomyces griseofuscus]